MKNEFSFFLILSFHLKVHYFYKPNIQIIAINEDAPDPTVIKDGDYYYLY